MKKTPIDEQVLRASKEIVVKFIEVGRISPSNFPEMFTSIYQAIHAAVNTESADGNAGAADEGP